MPIAELFESLVRMHFAFLDAAGFCVCEERTSDLGTRDASSRIRYYRKSACVDVELGLGLSLYVYLGELKDQELPCDSAVANVASVERMVSTIVVPSELTMGGANTLGEMFAKSYTRYHSKVAPNFEIAVAYLGERTRDVMSRSPSHSLKLP